MLVTQRLQNSLSIVVKLIEHVYNPAADHVRNRCFDLISRTHSWADWAAWHLPCGPVGPPSRWAATSNVVAGPTTYPVNWESVGREGRRGSEGQCHKEETRERWRHVGPGTFIVQEGWLYLDIFVGAPEFQVTPPLMGPVCLLSQGRFQEPVFTLCPRSPPQPFQSSIAGPPRNQR